MAAIDHGSVRLGIAISDPQRRFASPYETYTRRGPQADAQRLQKLVADEQITRFVVGLPVHLDGRESQQSQAARQFARWLGEVTGVPVDLFDERFTTSQAEEILGAAALRGRKRKMRRDMLAAQILLTAYLEAPSRATAEPGPLEDPS